jgi:hypothetical protein
MPMNATPASVIANVAAACHANTVRIGLLSWRSMASDFFAASKAAKVYPN